MLDFLLEHQHLAYDAQCRIVPSLEWLKLAAIRYPEIAPAWQQGERAHEEMGAFVTELKRAYRVMEKTL